MPIIVVVVLGITCAIWCLLTIGPCPIFFDYRAERCYSVFFSAQVFIFSYYILDVFGHS